MDTEIMIKNSTGTATISYDEEHEQWACWSQLAGEDDGRGPELDAFEALSEAVDFAMRLLVN